MDLKRHKEGGVGNDLEMGSWLAEQWLGKYSWRQHGLAFEKHPQKLPTLRSQNSLLTWLSVIGGKSPFQSPGEIFHMQWINLKVSPSRMWKDGCFFIYFTADSLSRLWLTTLFGGEGAGGELFSLLLLLMRLLSWKISEIQYPDYSLQNKTFISSSRLWPGQAGRQDSYISQSNGSS